MACQVKYCRSNSKRVAGRKGYGVDEIHFCRFPKDEKFKNIWMKAIGVNKLSVKEPRLCSIHFESKYIRKNVEKSWIEEHYGITVIKRRLLTPDAIPTLYLNGSESIISHSDANLLTKNHTNNYTDDKNTEKIPTTIQTGSGSSHSSANHFGLTDPLAIYDGNSVFIKKENENFEEEIIQSCAAINCKNCSEKGFHLFRLPADDRTKKQWLINMGHEVSPPESSYVCEVHFDISQWKQNPIDGSKVLKPNAIPTLFNNSILPVTVIKTEVFQICRICLKVEDDLMDLFKPASNDELPYLELIEHTSLQVRFNDGLPSYICKECFETLQSIKKFKEKCFHSDNLLKNYNGPNSIENFNDYILSKMQTEGIWYIDNGDDVETTTVDKQNHQENGNIEEKLNKLDEFLDKQSEIVQELITKIEQPKQNESLQFHKKRIKPLKPPVIHFPSNSPNNLPVIKEVIQVPKGSLNSKYELKDIVCHLCGKTVKYMDSHLKYVHNSSFEHKCEICGKDFRQAIQLRKHFVVHKDEKDYKCGICHRSFSRAQVRNRHIQTVHEKIRRFTCTLCSKSYHLANQLKVHLLTHTGERRYKCDVEGCNRQYMARRPLIRHKLQCHSNNPRVTGFQCTICLRLFTQERYLEEHLRVHTGVRPSKCNKCDKSFVSDRTLKKHMRVHISTAEKQQTEQANPKYRETM